MDREAFAQGVRDSIKHLHDRSYLSRHPLARELAADGHPLSGDDLRRALVDAIKQLRPATGAAPSSAEWRRYRHLVLRDVEGQSLAQIAQSLGVSPRQASRDYQEAVAAVSDLLWLGGPGRAVQQAQGGGSVSPVPASIAVPGLADEAASVAAGDAGTTDLAQALAGVLATIKPLADASGAAFRTVVSDTLPPLAVSRTLLRQALLSLLSYVLEVAPGARILLAQADTARGVTLRMLPEGRSDAGLSLRPPSPEAEQLLETGRQLLAAQGASVAAGDDPAIDPLLTLVLPPIPLRTVLVVDDNPDVVSLFRRFLRGEPYRLIQATTAASAVPLALSMRPNAVILDLMMPTQDGWDVLQQLRNHAGTRDLSVIVCSVLPERKLALSLGVDAFLPKPVTQTALREELARCCAAQTASPVHC